MAEASGDAVDAHGSNTLTETSGTIASATGIVGNCRDFEVGDTELFSIADNTDLSTGNIDFTISCWVQFESLGANRVLVAKWTPAGNIREYMLLYALATDTFRLTVTADGSTQVSVNGTNFGAPSTATWYHVVAWHDSTANVIGIAINDGTPNTAAHTTGVFDGTSAFRIGAQVAGDFHDGLIDEVGIWKRVLSAAEITELYNAGAGRDYAYISAPAGGLSIPIAMYHYMHRVQRAAF